MRIDAYELWIGNLKGISVSKKISLHEIFGTGRDIYVHCNEIDLAHMKVITAKEHELLIQSKKDIIKAEREWERLLLGGIRYIPFAHPDYPKKLSYINEKPYALYVKGSLPDPNKESVAIVGARECSAYGETMTVEICESLATYDVTIISGMARGIDGAAHRGALSKEGDTFAVLGCGVNICYPKEYGGLYQEISERGGILSEYPLDMQAKSYHFPARNRIISGLSNRVIVMEAKEKSGSLITADFALEQGKDVFALPGPVTSALSRGCNRLISQGAGIICGASGLLFELGLIEQNIGEKNEENKKALERVNNLVYSCLDFYPKNFEQLIEETKLPPSELLEELVMLELEGYIKEISKNYYRRIKI